MDEKPSYLSKPYAPALGTLIGTAIGVPISLVTHTSVIAYFSLLGLLIGYVISQKGKDAADHKDQHADDAIESRLRQLQDLRSKSIITEEEYQCKRDDILSQL